MARPDEGHGGHFSWAPAAVAGECLARVRYVVQSPAAQSLSLDNAADRERLLKLVEAELRHL